MLSVHIFVLCIIKFFGLVTIMVFFFLISFAKNRNARRVLYDAWYLFLILLATSVSFIFIFPTYLILLSYIYRPLRVLGSELIMSVIPSSLNLVEYRHKQVFVIQ